MEQEAHIISHGAIESTLQTGGSRIEIVPRETPTGKDTARIEYFEIDLNVLTQKQVAEIEGKKEVETSTPLIELRVYQLQEYKAIFVGRIRFPSNTRAEVILDRINVLKDVITQGFDRKVMRVALSMEEIVIAQIAWLNSRLFPNGSI